MNFRRGKQMIVYDPGLNHLSGSRMSLQLTPPVAFRRWTLHSDNTPGYIISRVADLAAQVQGLDAVHFMGHGSPGSIAVGSGHLNNSNADLFGAFSGVVKNIVFFSCQSGGEHQGASWHRGHARTLGQRISEASGARVVVAQETQMYRRTSNNVIDFGQWEGPIDVYQGNTLSTHQAYNPFRTVRSFDLERVIFND